MEKMTKSTPTHQPLPEKKTRTQEAEEIKEKEEGVPKQERRSKKDNGLGFPRSNVDVRKRGRPIGKSISSSRKQKSHKSAPIWAENWLLRKKVRTDGRTDKYYVHKAVRQLTCRSLQEVERYEKDGIRPGAKGKTSNKEKTKAKTTTKKQTEEMHALGKQIDETENGNLSSRVFLQKLKST